MATAHDLYPAEDWNFVFGQASLVERVGVWSLARFGDPDESDEAFHLCLRRTVKGATHETGHMQRFRHCVAYQCGMNGSNHLDETDAAPIEFCPECQAKIWWTCEVDPADRARKLAGLAREYGWAGDAEYWTREADCLAGRAAR